MTRGKPKTVVVGQLQDRLTRIANVIEGVENRCMAVDGPVTPTHQEITDRELIEIYELARPGQRARNARATPKIIEVKLRK